jgi:hypothetical protein
MSESRSKKFKKSNVITIAKNFNIFDYDPNQVLRDASWQYQANVVPKVNYPVSSIKDLFKNTPYSDICTTIRMEGSVGKGFNTVDDPEMNLYPTDPIITDNWDCKDIRKATKDYLHYGIRTLELVIYDNKVLTGYYIPYATVHKGRKEKKGYWVQNLGQDNEIWIKEFDKDLYEQGRHPNGNYIYVTKNGSEEYGVPSWISAMTIMKIMKEQYRVVLSHFINDAEPSETNIWYGNDVTTEEGKKFKAARENAYQGSDKKGKSEHIFSRDNRTEVGDVLQRVVRERTIISKDDLDLMMRNAFTVTASFRIPSFMLGLEQAGKLGNANEVKVLYWNYINGVLAPDQRLWYEDFNLWYGKDVHVQFNTETMPDLDSQGNDDVTTSKGAYAKGVENTLKDVISLVNSTEYTLKQLEELEKE